MSGVVRSFAGVNFNPIPFDGPRENFLLECKFGSGGGCELELSSDAFLWQQISGVRLVDRHVIGLRNE